MKSSPFPRAAIIGGLLALLPCLSPAQPPLRSHPDNPRILEFRGKPTLLMTYAEHYSSVINSNFDYIPYLDQLRRDGMNLTRVFLLGYRGAGDGTASPLVASPASFVQPWPRSSAAGAALDGQGKWDLNQWNETYFSRLKAFTRAAADRGIVVEMTFFCTFYNEDQWRASPFHPSNNIQAWGPASRYDSMRPANANLFGAQERAVRRIVRELNAFDNIYFEIQNEPFWNEPGAGDAQEIDFHHRMLSAIRSEESALPNRHLVAHNFPQHAGSMSAGFDIINEHYPVPIVFHSGSTPVAGAENLLQHHYQRSRILALDETDTREPAQTRLEAWMFIHGGGGIYNGLDVPNFVYTERNPAGNSALGNAFRKAVRDAANHAAGLDLVNLRRDFSWIRGGTPNGARVQAMAVPGQQYVAYFYHGGSGRAGELSYHPIDSSNHNITLTAALPAGQWRVIWTRPNDLAVLREDTFSHGGGDRTLPLVTYQADVALRIDRTAGTPGDPPEDPPADPPEDPPPADHGVALVNGSFEAGYQGWFAQGNQALTSGGGLASDGVRSVAFNNGNTTPNGVLAQSFATVAGASYRVSFDAGTLSYRQSAQRLGVELAGSSLLASKDITLPTSGGGKVEWSAQTISFTADSETTTLIFRDRSDPGASASVDLLLDRVAVTPEN